MMLKNIGEAQHGTFIQDVVRTGLQVPQKRHQKLKRVVDSAGTAGSTWRANLLRQVSARAWDQPGEFHAWQSRHLVFLYNELASDYNSLVHFMLDLEKVVTIPA